MCNGKQARRVEQEPDKDLHAERSRSAETSRCTRIIEKLVKAGSLTGRYVEREEEARAL